MYIFNLTILGTLLVILMILYKEERRLRLGASYGKLDRYLILKERRRYVRFETDIDIYYKRLDESSIALRNGKAKDVSKAGLGLLLYEKLKPGDFLEVNFNVPDTQKAVKAIGELMWLNEGPRPSPEDKRTFRAGIRFKDIDLESEALLILYINKLKDKK